MSEADAAVAATPAAGEDSDGGDVSDTNAVPGEARRASQHTMDKHGILINELTSSDGQLVSTLRVVYEAEDGHPGQFADSLTAYTKRMDTDIERMCNKYYESFIESIEELLTVRSSASDLKELITDGNDRLLESGHELLKSTEDLVAKRLIQKNILTAIEALSACLPVLRLYCKAISQLKQERYYPALKSLHELERDQLPVVCRYTFAKMMRARIPMLRLKVKQAAFVQLQDFLANIRDRCREIGEAAMMQSLKTQNMDVTYGDTDFGEDLCASDQADFSPLYRALHIYTTLGVRDEAQKYYREERRKQAQLVLQPVANMDTTNGYRDYLHQVAGFFLVEDTVLSTTAELLSRQWVDDLWESALIKVAAVIQEQLSRCRTATTIYGVKQLIVLFCQTLQGYGYSVARLFDILLQVKERFVAVLQEATGNEFRAIFAGDNYTPMQVTTEEEFLDVLAVYPYEDRVLQEAPFPRTFPFSRAVPEVFTRVEAFIKEFIKFVEGLDLSSTEIDEAVRKAANALLSKTLSGVVSEVIRKGNLGLPQLTQISVNTTHLERACDRLQEHISKLTHSIEDATTTRLHGVSAFKEARTAAEDKIFSVLQVQIDMFLELADYDWAPAMPMTDSSEYLFDLLAYLTTIFASLTNLPIDVARAAYFSTCKYISGQLIGLISNPQIKRINLNGIKNFALDIGTCEQYAENCPLVRRGDELFQGVFVQLRELVDLFLHWDWETFLGHQGRAEKYSHLKPHAALRILDKFDDSAAKSMFGFKSPEDKKKSKQTDSIHKRLKQLVARNSGTDLGGQNGASHA
eukprot:m.6941 g.6941  ORF g.6941 m.6941 type:complete len:806 (-) comp2777_c0_seq2:85-2502(-)